MTQSITIIVDLPPRALSPNGRANWRTLHAAKKKYMNHVGLLIVEHGIPDSCPWARARTRTRFVFTKKRNRDADNLSAMLKPAWDAFQRCMVIENDSGFIHEPPEIRVDHDGVEGVFVCVERIE